MRFIVMLAVAAAAVLMSLSPVSAQSTPHLTLSVICNPDSIRPDSEAVFLCTMNVTSNEDEPVDGVSLAGNLAEGAALPSFEIFDRVVDGVPSPVSPGQTTFEFPTIPPNNTVSSDGRVIFGVREPGTYGFHLDLLVDGVVVDGQDLTFEATASSPYPPTGLTVTKTLVEVDGAPLSPPTPAPVSPPQGLSPSEGFPLTGATATYDIAITNTGDVPLDDIVLFDRRSDGASIDAGDPPPDDDSADTGIAMWELGTLGLGDVFVVRVTLTHEPGGCASSSGTAVVEGRVSTETERYHARADRAVVLGEDCPLGQGGNGGGTEVEALPDTGAGGDARPVVWPWVVVALGAGLFALGLGTLRVLR